MNKELMNELAREVDKLGKSIDTFCENRDKIIDDIDKKLDKCIEEYNKLDTYVVISVIAIVNLYWIWLLTMFYLFY